jgi:hypothetical protein
MGKDMPKIQGRSMTKIFTMFLVTSLLNCYFLPALAAIPKANRYRIEQRAYALEPSMQRYNISAKDEGVVVKPATLYYTALNPLAPKALYTIPPYPNTYALPKIGKWMSHMLINSTPYYKSKLPPRINQDKITYTPAHWINLKNPRGQYIIEVINYLFVVYADNNKQAIESLKQRLTTAGFSSKDSKYHGGDYFAVIDGKLYKQLRNKSGKLLAFSNEPHQQQNDHLRVMGPEKIEINNQKAFLFVGSVSEESGAQPLPSKEYIKKHINRIWHVNFSHQFVSFDNARNNLAVALIQHGNPTYYVAASNVLNTTGLSTEDHDGKVFVSVISPKS